ncbi:insect cuticle protein [Holotrichia oblita]|uniref:Insect cuticle protein n=1 Tax=Holotrichia oblita TaxID=644536 RepID=A0ACB9STZ8_HOLOL|nr:insect cuticle protein [Holotrichia oblita]
MVLSLTWFNVSCQSFNPAILQDSRDLPKVDGRFGFLYRTEDGIAHAAQGEPGGQVRGRFTYTDPTGLKVNFNYNAGSKTAPGYNYNEPLSSYEQNNYPQKSSNERNRPPQAQYEDQYDDGSYRAQESEQYDYIPQRRSRPPSLRDNAINNY